MAIDAGLSTLADECAAQGRDWEDVMAQRKREQDRAKELGIEEPAPPTAAQLERRQSWIEETIDEPVGAHA